MFATFSWKGRASVAGSSKTDAGGPQEVCQIASSGSVANRVGTHSRHHKQEWRLRRHDLCRSGNRMVGVTGIEPVTPTMST